MRILYSLILYLVAPFIPIYLKYRGRKNPHYNLNWSERFAFKLHNPNLKPIVWLHAVSVGETRAMVKLVELLETRYPNYQILITHMTPTARNIAKNLFKNAYLHYIPYDMPHAVINFYQTFKPRLGLIMETEIWPNLIFYANTFTVPLYLINARLSDKSFTSYRKIKWFITPILNKLSGIICQDQNTANNFSNLGFNQELKVAGSTKFDISVEAKVYDLAKHLKQNIANKKIVAFASTRDGEEELILENLPVNFDYLIIIIPRHPERFSLVEELISKHNLKYQKRSEDQAISPTTQILLGNSLGEMFVYYALADLAVIGGSFNNFGGQNLIEAIFMHKPVIFGTSMFNFATIAKNALLDKCAIQVKDIQECFYQIDNLFNNTSTYAKLANNCQAFIGRYQGASVAILDHVAKYL